MRSAMSLFFVCAACAEFLFRFVLKNEATAETVLLIPKGLCRTELASFRFVLTHFSHRFTDYIGLSGFVLQNFRFFFLRLEGFLPFPADELSFPLACDMQQLLREIQEETASKAERKLPGQWPDCAGSPLNRSILNRNVEARRSAARDFCGASKASRGGNAVLRKRQRERSTG
jgi:hypothetical protein